MNLPQDHAARAAALDPRRSFAVTAPAGSGKTGLLTQRVLTLLASCDYPEEVICITFTRKAAAEMRERIVSALQTADRQPCPADPHARLTWQLAKEVLEQDRQRHWQLLKNPARLRVQTIDGLCRALTQHNPIASGTGGSSQLLEQPQLVYRQAVEQTLAGLEDSGPLQHDLAELLRHLDNNIETVITLLVRLLGQRDQWLAPLMNARDARQYLESVLCETVEETLAEVRALLQPLASDLCLLADYAGSQCQQENPDSILTRLAGLTELPAASPTELEDWCALTELLCTQKGDWRSARGLNKNVGFPPGRDKEDKQQAKLRKEQMSALLGELAERPKLLPLLQLIRILPPVHYPHNQWRLLDGLTRILPALVVQLKLVFRSLNATDFSEITQGALLALGEEDRPGELMLQLDYQIRHILVDEFQDTASPQLQLLEKLTAGWQDGDGRSLFIVGDGMQSCYGFRDANVGIFLDARNSGIGRVALTPLELTVNFRSQAGVVEWVNSAFAQAFPEADDISRGAVRYAPSVAFKPALPGPAVTTHITLDAEDRRAEARQVTELVQAALREDPEGRVAVLVRNRSHLSEVLVALQQAGLRWQATDIDPLSSRMAIVDLMSLTRALLDPSDRNAWLALLRSPMLGLDNADLLRLANHRRDTDARQFPSLFDNLLRQRELQGLSSQGQQLLARAVPLLKAAWQERRRKHLRPWIEGLWTALGGPAGLTDAVDLNNVRDFFQLLEQYDEGGRIGDRPAFEAAVNQLYARPVSDADARIQVMTIHKSKGLEFETVIIPGLDRPPRADDKPLLLWQERINRQHEKQLLLGPLSATGDEDDPIYRFLWQEQKLKSSLEASRLLYVGCTRAIKRLHLLAQLSTDSKSGLPKAPSASSLLACLWPVVKESADYRTAPPPANGELHPPRQTELAVIRRLQPEWQRPPLIPDNLLAAFRGREFGDEDNQVSDDYLRHRARRYSGTVLHRTLCQVVTDGLAHWDSDRISRQRPFWQAQLQQAGLAGSALSDALDRVELGLLRSLNDPVGQWLLDNQHSESACELSLWSRSAGGEARNAIIDRTFVENGQRWIIDYKSSEPAADQTLETFLQAETQSYSEQLNRYRRLFPDQPVKMALYFPLLAHLQPVEQE